MAYYKGKEGFWFTTDTGRHIFCERGKSKEEAMKEAFDFEEEDENEYQNKVSEIINDKTDTRNDKIYRLGSLFEYEYYEDKVKEGSKLYKELSEKKAEEILSKFPRIKNNDLETTLKYANDSVKKTKDKYCPNGDWDYSYPSKELHKAYSEIKGRNTNCQRCVVAWYLRSLGYDVEAKTAYRFTKDYKKRMTASDKRIWENRNRISNWQGTVFNIPDERKYSYKGKISDTPETQYENIKKIVEMGPDGATYFIQVKWEDKKGHVFIIHNDGGEMLMIEPQNNSYRDKSTFNKIGDLSETKLLRVDDLTLDGNYINDYVEVIKMIEKIKKWYKTFSHEKIANIYEYQGKYYITFDGFFNDLMVGVPIFDNEIQEGRLPSPMMHLDDDLAQEILEFGKKLS